MKTILLTVAALLLATPAWAGGGAECEGKVEHAGRFVYFTNDNTVECMIQDKALGKRFLKVCQVGSYCTIWVGDGQYRMGGRAVEERTMVITKWPGNEFVAKKDKP